MKSFSCELVQVGLTTLVLTIMQFDFMKRENYTSRNVQRLSTPVM